MAGRGARLAGFGAPKPLIEISGRPMVAWALDGVARVPRAKTVFVALEEHEAQYGVTATLRSIAPDCEVVLLPDVTEGQLCTVLAARRYLDTDDDVLIASSDTLVVSNLQQALEVRSPDLAGLISVIDAPGDRWSFARTDGTDRVVEVAEKVRISNHASTGLYWFANGRDLLRRGDALVAANERTRGEFYVMPLYAKYLEAGLPVAICKATAMWDMGTPDALERFRDAREAGVL